MHAQQSSTEVRTIFVTQHKMLQFFELWVNVFQHTPVMGGYHTLEKITHQATEHINFVYTSNVLRCSITIFSSPNAYIVEYSFIREHYFLQKFIVVIHFPMLGHCKFLTYYPNIWQHCTQHLPLVSIQIWSLQPLWLTVAACVNLRGLWTKTLCMCLMVSSYTYKCPTSFMCTKLLVCQN
jgi:hypothetical protein